jgi:hypothetical protein
MHLTTLAKVSYLQPTYGGYRWTDADVSPTCKLIAIFPLWMSKTEKQEDVGTWLICWHKWPLAEWNKFSNPGRIFAWFFSCYSQCSHNRHDALVSQLCIINIFSTTCLSLDDQQNNKSSPTMPCLPISVMYTLPCGQLQSPYVMFPSSASGRALQTYHCVVFCVL